MIGRPHQPSEEVADGQCAGHAQGIDWSMTLRFAWDAGKAEANLRKHGVSFVEAATAFGDPLSITIPDPAHSQDATRRERQTYEEAR